MPKSIIESMGQALGRKFAQAKNAFDLMGGDDEESLRAEVRLGSDMAAAYVERMPLVYANETTRFAAQTGRWLAGHVKEKRLPVSVLVTAEPEPNAMALPGGFIFVSRPLLDLCGGERDQIAFVLGHELGHIILRHTLDRILQDAALSLLLRKATPRVAAGKWLNETGRQVLRRAFNREQEFEADLFAESLIKRAGGDALAAEDFLTHADKVVQRPSVTTPNAYFAAHPPFKERIAQLRRAGNCNPPRE